MTTLPEIHIAGTFPLREAGNNRTYVHNRYALHLFDYDVQLSSATVNLQAKAHDLSLIPPGEAVFFSAPTPGFHLCIRFACDQPEFK